ncbi:MAG: hypothetical protein QXX19_09325 [Candidatus Caldarchaeum sp.]
MFENPTRTQHFISQAEQRLNGIPPDRNRIYQFEIIDRENHILKLVSKNGVSIRNNLAIEDLYSFDKSGELRKNFENLFQRYEQRIKSAVEALEEKLLKKSDTDLGGLLYEIWLLKFLNIWRNPYGVKKCLNTFHMMTRFHPLDRYFLDCYRQIDNLQKSDLLEGFPDLDLSLKEYKEWLKVMLLLLMPNPKSSARPGNHPGNLFEQIAYDLLTDTSFIRAVKIQMLSESFAGRFLLNDRSYFYSSEPTDPNKLILNFNISDRIAMTFMIVNPQEIVNQDITNDPILKQYDPFTQNWLIQQSLAEITQNIQLRPVFDDKEEPVFDDKEEVEQFNQGMIFQARRYVFCSQKEVIGATVRE